ncbi:hypothetical protein H2200_002748 [Cladophialophora chaetospira]|uniref:LSM complex subunit LSM4 n=1 Tax=Cladophialophora chaetospira TaxID=386627 RepID=A0AA38XJJ7_9EURO|nr:hypothetical protein H2200_002748 [Cladophialophora chaetospira]
MLPLGLLTAAQGHPMLVELKNGETLNGHLVNCDTWMNLTLKEVVQTSPEGDKFWRLPECYVRGNNIKYLRVPEEIIDLAREQQQQQQHRQDGEAVIEAVGAVAAEEGEVEGTMEGAEVEDEVKVRVTRSYDQCHQLFPATAKMIQRKVFKSYARTPVYTAGVETSTRLELQILLIQPTANLLLVASDQI